MGVFLIPPDITIDEKTKKCVGREINVTRRILSEYGINLSVVCAPAMRIYRMIEDGTVGLP